MENARRRAGLRALGRALQWKPRTYKQAWLVALFVLSGYPIIGIIFLAFGYRPHLWSWYTAYMAVSCVLGAKAGYTISEYRYRRRQR
jgi:hypothetical protein